ncbi:EAL domain-containing protein [Bacillus salipaludis]|uniref:sensor domain-containing protein n=1 Tax=Bacillus salipaludis TaxID=2547811 RepID=UPI003D208669
MTSLDYIVLIPIAVFFLVISSFKRKISGQSEALQLNEQYYKSLFEQNPDIIITFDLEGRILNANKAVDALGYSLDDIRHKPFTPFIVPEELEETTLNFNKAVNGESVTYECEIFDQKGRKRDIAATNIPIYINGKITGVYAIIKEITVQKKAQKKLIEAEAKYRSLVENSLVGVYIYQNGKIMYVNPRLCEITGYRHDEILSLNLEDVIAPKDYPSVLENFNKLITNVDATTTYQFRMFRKDRVSITLETYGSKIDYNGEDAIIGTVIDITKRKNNEKMIKYMAYHDQLTDLPNRHYFKEKFEEVLNTSKQQNENFAILFLDLDRFKAINDFMGHEVGDMLLTEVAERLKNCMDEKGMVSRFGGDEFCFLLPETNEKRAVLMAKRVIAALSSPFHINHHEILITPSIGISLFPEHGEDFNSIIKNADIAMYYAKDRGKNNFAIFTKEIKNKSQNELELEMKLRKALERNEFILQYQPQFNLETNQIIGAEALIRWQHPEKGLISPNEFIPVAEESGLIIPMGEWALRTACQQNKEWQLAGLPPITIAVNISAKQFFQSNLVETVEKILFETDLEPNFLELEITESMTMDVEHSVSTLLALKDLGVKISIDDFGTGYSSLNYLKRFPIDKLKIDQSFIRESTTDANDRTIVKAIILMAHFLKIKVIAEGVETEDHVSFLLSQQCKEAQGYYFSKPVSADEFETRCAIVEDRIQGKS